MTRRGRPLGFVARAVYDALSARPRTLRELALDLQLPYDRADVALRSLRARGQVAMVATVPTATRPAGVFAPAERAAEAPSPAAELHLVMGLMIRSGRGGR